MRDPSIYRSFGRTFIGTRPKVRLGDPSIDERWIKRRQWGWVIGAGWFALLPLVLGAGLVSHWGIFRQLDSMAA